jgi:hypothetical protein
MGLVGSEMCIRDRCIVNNQYLPNKLLGFRR